MLDLEDKSTMELEGAEREGASDCAYGVPNSTHSVVEKVLPRVGRWASLKIEPQI